ncbi:uncharacterized protein LOC133919016 isoform X2 [Phragmites australis]|uniref:uncharacterized protein LOC133919016 isoform X2 n=1 Tax=Phragmites australis TaxID=29695 RepID=UPI002D76681E|nr:uncharacterized protein LOC133919016 isoform X2 [Phragmites australis]
MATTCDDVDFGLLGDEDDAHHPPQTHPDPPHPSLPPPQGFYLPQKSPVSPVFAEDSASHFSHDLKNNQAAAKRRGCGVVVEEPGVVGKYRSPYLNSSGKKGRGGGEGAAHNRKDGREEWSDGAICTLLNAYTERFEQLQRGTFRGRDWEDVAAAVASQHPARDGGGKSVDQCKNKMDNLKKRYKVECQRIDGGTSKWPWFKKMEVIVGGATSIASPKPAAATADDVKPRDQQQQNKSCTPSSASLLSIGVGSRLTPLSNPRWKRALLKIGGSVLAGAASENVDPKVIMLIAREVQVASLHGVQVAIVVGSRNIYCGDTWAAETGIERAATCPIGMMASVLNAVLLQASLEKIGIETRVQTTLVVQDATEPYIRRRAIRHLEKGRVVIFGGIGAAMGNPLFTTDTAAALRASEINADVLLKGITGDTVNGCTPESNGDAEFEHISYRELVARGFSKMDVIAITFCEENNIPGMILLHRFSFVE